MHYTMSMSIEIISKKETTGNREHKYTFMVRSRDALAKVFVSLGLNVTCIT